jgi:putative addiction module component (TIGR02574 family)
MMVCEVPRKLFEKRETTMNIPATLVEIAGLPVSERIRLVQAIWDTIALEEAFPDLTEKQKQDLDRRVAELNANPDNVLTWEQIKAQVRISFLDQLPPNRYQLPCAENR